MELEEFEKLVEEAALQLPEGIRTRMDNVAIVVEAGESPNNSLFGLYHGVPQTQRGSGYGTGAVLPDKITIWKGTIERFAESESAIPALVRRVVWHEIGHHFGFGEDQIRKLEKKWEADKRV